MSEPKNSGNVGILVLISLVGFVIGGLMLNFVYGGYRQKEALIGVALFTLASVFMGIAVARIGKRAVGVIVFVLGTAVAFGVLKLAMMKEERLLSNIHKEVAVGDAAAAVCAGVPNGVTKPRQPGEVHPIMRAHQGTESKEWFGGPWSGLTAPELPQDLALVACVVEQERPGPSCSYESKDGKGSYHVYKVRRSHVITVRDAKTLAVLAEKTFDGDEPSDKCDDVIVSTLGDQSTTVSGGSPSDADEVAFLNAFVHPNARE